MPSATEGNTRLPNVFPELYLFINFPLQLHDLVLQANVKLLVAFHRPSLYLQFLQLPLGHHAPVTALQVNNCLQGPTVVHSSQPASYMFLNNNRLVLSKHLQFRKNTTSAIRATPAQLNRLHNERCKDGVNRDTLVWKEKLLVKCKRNESGINFLETEE